MSSPRELGERFRARPSAQPNELSGVIKRALDEVCAIFGATEALLVWEEAEEPWVMVGTLRGGAFTYQPGNVRSAGRNWNAPASRDNNVGLRPARIYR